MADHLQSRATPLASVREPCEGSRHFIENGCSGFMSLEFSLPITHIFSTRTKTTRINYFDSSFSWSLKQYGSVPGLFLYFTKSFEP